MNKPADTCRARRFVGPALDVSVPWPRAWARAVTARSSVASKSHQSHIPQRDHCPHCGHVMNACRRPTAARQAWRARRLPDSRRRCSQSAHRLAVRARLASVSALS